MTIKQISVFVENKEGRLAEITNVLAENKIDIRALSIADTTDYGILRLIVNDPEKAVKVLKEAKLTVSPTDVLAVGVDDTPGGFAKAIGVLSEAKIGVEYAYAFVTPTVGKAYVILRVNDNDSAAKALEAAGFEPLNQSELFS